MGLDLSETLESKQIRDKNAQIKNGSESFPGLLQCPLSKTEIGTSRLERQQVVQRLVDEFQASRRHACELIGIPRWTFSVRTKAQQ
jgi:hypothetical protein